MNGECTSWVSRPFQAGVVADAPIPSCTTLDGCGLCEVQVVRCEQDGWLELLLLQGLPEPLGHRSRFARLPNQLVSVR